MLCNVSLITCFPRTSKTATVIAVLLALTIFTNPKEVGLGYTLKLAEAKSSVDKVVGVTSAQVAPIRNSSNKMKGVSPDESCLIAN